MKIFVSGDSHATEKLHGHKATSIVHSWLLITVLIANQVS